MRHRRALRLPQLQGSLRVGERESLARSPSALLPLIRSLTVCAIVSCCRAGDGRRWHQPVESVQPQPFHHPGSVLRSGQSGKYTDRASNPKPISAAGPRITQLANENVDCFSYHSCQSIQFNSIQFFLFFLLGTSFTVKSVSAEASHTHLQIPSYRNVHTSAHSYH